MIASSVTHLQVYLHFSILKLSGFMLSDLLHNSSDSMNIKRVLCILNAVALGTAATLEEATAMAFRHNERARGVSGQQIAQAR